MISPVLKCSTSAPSLPLALLQSVPTTSHRVSTGSKLSAPRNCGKSSNHYSNVRPQYRSSPPPSAHHRRPGSFAAVNSIDILSNGSAASPCIKLAFMDTQGYCCFQHLTTGTKIPGILFTINFPANIHFSPTFRPPWRGCVFLCLDFKLAFTGRSDLGWEKKEI